MTSTTPSRAKFVPSKRSSFWAQLIDPPPGTQTMTGRFSPAFGAQMFRQSGPSPPTIFFSTFLSGLGWSGMLPCFRQSMTPSCAP